MTRINNISAPNIRSQGYGILAVVCLPALAALPSTVSAAGDAPSAPSEVHAAWVMTDIDTSTYPETNGRLTITWKASQNATSYSIESLHPRKQPIPFTKPPIREDATMRVEKRLNFWELSSLENPFIIVRFRVCAINEAGRNCVIKANRGLEGVKDRKSADSDILAAPYDVPMRSRPRRDEGMTITPEAVGILVKPGKFGSKIMTR